MFRTIGDQPSLWESRLPAEMLRLPEDLVRVDALLDDPVFFAPFAQCFYLVLGRPSTPGGVLPAADVSQVPPPAGVRELVR
jgi:transposase, IS5 family